MYEYILVDEPKAGTKSLFSRDGANRVINVRKVEGELEVSLATDRYNLSFDIKLVGNRLWSRHGLTPEQYTEYRALLTQARERFPEQVDGFEGWYHRKRS